MFGILTVAGAQHDARTTGRTAGTEPIWSLHAVWQSHRSSEVDAFFLSILSVVCVVCGEAWHAENPCVDSKRLRVYGQDVSVCTGNTLSFFPIFLFLFLFLFSFSSLSSLLTTKHCVKNQSTNKLRGVRICDLAHDSCTTLASPFTTSHNELRSPLSSSIHQIKRLL